MKTDNKKCIYFRLTNNDKVLLEQAALLNHQTINNYIISVVLKQASIDFEQNNSLILNNSDRNLIMDLLDNPPEPNESLINLFNNKN